MLKFCPIRRYLSPDLAVGSANGWRCSYGLLGKRFEESLGVVYTPSVLKNKVYIFFKNVKLTF
jgi:hypothetical protein